MKCPHCNQEHPEDIKFCPITGKKIELLKACTNTACPDYDKHILPMESCFCPTCGKKILTSNIFVGGNKNDNPTQSTSQSNSKSTINSKTDELHKFFPVEGITLGETTLAEVLEKNNYDDIKYYNRDNIISNRFCKTGSTHIFYHTGKLEFRSHGNVFTEMVMAKSTGPMLPHWKQQGLDWSLSYNKLMQLFKTKGYSINIDEKPHMLDFGTSLFSTWNILTGKFFYATVFSAISPDSTIKFKLTFFSDIGCAFHENDAQTLGKIEVICMNR